MMNTEFQNRVLDAFDKGSCPMTTVYGLCARMGEHQQHSKQKFYVRVYRALDKLVDSGQVWVMRGTRDPSVYLAKKSVKGFDKLGISEMPF